MSDRARHSWAEPAPLRPLDYDGTVPPDFSQWKIPAHVAIVMDGNGRWANARGLPRTEGHRAGEGALLDVVAGAVQAGVRFLTVYAFSTENWKRSPAEVRFLMGFNREVLRRRRDQLNAWNVRIRWAGRRPRLWRSVIEELEEAAELTKRNTGLTLTMCVNYGSRVEIVDAVRELAAQARDGRITPRGITERSIAAHLSTDGAPDVDVMIRTSGERRISNFLLWQAAYAELVFQQTLWPDYRRADLWEAIAEYGRRDRRFGGAVDHPAE